MSREWRGVVGREVHHRQHSTVARVEGDDSPAAGAERLRGDLLQLLGERERDVRVVLLGEEQVAQPAELELLAASGEQVVVGSLHAVGSVREREVAGDGTEQRALRVFALELEVVLGVDRARQDGTVGRLHRVPCPGEVADDRLSVGRMLVEAVGIDDLPVVEEPEQHDVQGREDHTQAADLLVHTRYCTRVSSAPTAAACRSALSLLMRSSRARRM